MVYLAPLLFTHLLCEFNPLHGFVKNLDEKFGRIALNKDYGHYLRAILCLFRPDFPQNPCSTDIFRIMLDWQKIDTILLDMDGTLLDLNFDNHFWQEFVPQSFAKQQQITLTEAKRQLVPQFKAMQGKLEWYCLDYWSDVLQLDIVGLKREIAGLISILPHVTDFLSLIKQSPRQVILVTNAHRDSLDLKMEKTCLQHFFNELVSSHDFGKPKEHTDFWPLFQDKYLFDPQRTVLIDDNLAVLSSARDFGIKHVISVSLPDTSKAKRVIDGYPAIEDFRELMIGL